MVYSDEQWERERPQIYGPRSAKADCGAFLDRMQRELDQQAAQTEKGLPDHPYASCHERFDSGQAAVSRNRSVSALGLDVLQEGEHHSGSGGLKCPLLPVENAPLCQGC
jgi:hypothetical protein